MWLEAFHLRNRIRPNGGIYSNEPIMDQTCIFQNSRKKEFRCPQSSDIPSNDFHKIGIGALMELGFIYAIGTAFSVLVFLLENVFPQSRL